MFDPVAEYNIDMLIEHITTQSKTINQLIVAVKEINKRVEQLEKDKGGK